MKFVAILALALVATSPVERQLANDMLQEQSPQALLGPGLALRPGPNSRPSFGGR